jgi:hypothetical protein
LPPHATATRAGSMTHQLARREGFIGSLLEAG